MSLDLGTIVEDFAFGFKQADSKFPTAVNVRSKQEFQPGLGPHSEAETIKLVMNELARMYPERYVGQYATGVAYPESARRKCDLCLGQPPGWEWAIEVKMIRFLGDNGKVNDNILMHVLSPYAEHRSALTDCDKLIQFSLKGKKAILIYGFDHEEWPLDPAVEAFETLARARVRLGKKYMAGFADLIHPIHRAGRVFGWEIIQGSAT